MKNPNARKPTFPLKLYSRYKTTKLRKFLFLYTGKHVIKLSRRLLNDRSKENGRNYFFSQTFFSFKIFKNRQIAEVFPLI